jgi:ketosteroid isomerase-like protein
MNRKWITTTLLLLLACSCTAAQAAEDVKKEVTKVLDDQIAAWNRGSIDEFMRGYEVSESTVFTSGARVVRGWKNMLDRYRSAYGNGDIGKLQFSEIEVTAISKDAALVLGRWQLQRAGQQSGGVFTLLFRKTRAGWRIIHDHTSTSQ